LDEIPKNSTGKPQRNGLAKLLGLTEARSQMTVESLAPRTPSEIKLAPIWAEVLGIDELGIHDNFFDLGGHSLAATRIVSLVLKQFQLEIPLRSLFESPTIAQMGEVIAEYQGKQIDVGELDRLLTEIETMTEGEAQKLLALSEKTKSS
jgi:acyl carrier protein